MKISTKSVVKLINKYTIFVRIFIDLEYAQNERRKKKKNRDVRKNMTTIIIFHN